MDIKSSFSLKAVGLACALYVPLNVLANSSAAALWGLGVQLGISEFASSTNASKSYVLTSLGYAKSSAAASACVPVAGIDDLIAKVNSLPSTRAAYPAISSYRQELAAFIDANCSCSGLVGANTRTGIRVNKPERDVPMRRWTVNAAKVRYEGNSIFADPGADGATSYYKAPEAMLGQWTGLRQITFRKRSWGGSYYSPNAYGANGDIILKNGTMAARFDIAPEHSGNWRSFSVSLSDPGWKFSGGARSIADVLSAVDNFQIRAEYGAGTDYSALADVQLR